ncbi:MAG TPA: AraC family transcriptional regulator [Alphaproteobacteria bacterium]|nr:AraC family transcriptional regulator [Alphaproteobacteria bacterium]
MGNSEEPGEDLWQIEAELRVPGMTVQVGHYDWTLSHETEQTMAEYTLAMLLSPRHRFSQGAFDTDEAKGAFVDIGDLILVPAGIPMRSRASGGPIRFVRCRYTPERFHALTGFSAEWTQDTLKHCLDIRDARLHEALMRLAHEVLAPGFGVEALVEGMGATIAIDLARHIRAIDPEPEMVAGGLAPWQHRRIVGYIDSHPGATGNVTELAALCGISCRHLRRLFKQTTKQTLHEYIRDAWVAKAKSLLCDTDLPLKEITSQIGFTDPSSFSMAFRRATGAAPRTFRQQFAKGGFVARSAAGGR